MTTPPGWGHPQQAHYPLPPNPYAPTETNGNAAVRERVAILEEKARVQQILNEGQLDTNRHIYDRFHHLEATGARVVSELPAMIDARVAPVERRLDRMEEPWWAPAKPLLWKVYMAIAIIVAARLYRFMTGEPLDIMAIFAFLRGG